MNPIARVMKRYIKMPLNKALPLLFIGALLLAGTTGCVSFKDRKMSYTSDYNGHKIEFERVESIEPDIGIYIPMNEPRKEETITVDGAKMHKTFVWQTSKVKDMTLYYPNGTINKKTFDTPISDPYPGLEAGKLLVNKMYPTSSPTAEPTVPPLPPESDIGDNSHVIDITPELPVEGDHSHVEGGV